MARKTNSNLEKRSRVPLIDRIKAELAVEGLTGKKRKARFWLNQKLTSLSLEPQLIVSDKTRRATQPMIGKMFFYYYDAKWKDKLPFWDAFPLVIPMEFYNNGWLGLNFHYLTPNQRVYLISRLMEFSNTRNNLTEETRLKWNYGLLRSMRNFPMAKPAIKRYLTSHIRSHLIEIPAPEWDIALFLPVENFKVAKSRVWSGAAY